MAKYALTVGINRYGHGNDLSGCTNDAEDWTAALTARGYTVTKMLDATATGENITTGIAELVANAKRGDSVVITYSGHGTWVPDTSGDEPDGRDEAICPVDLWDHGVITDDTLHDLFSAHEPGVRAVFISDSCHSGSVSRFAPPLRPDYDPTEPILAHRRPRYLAPEAFLTAFDLRRAARVEHRALAGRPRFANLLIAGCKDGEYSYDAWFGGRANGAFTRAALDAFAQQSGDRTYRQWFADVRRRLPSEDFPDQTPQLYGTSTQKHWRALT